MGLHGGETVDVGRNDPGALGYLIHDVAGEFIGGLARPARDLCFGVADDRDLPIQKRIFQVPCSLPCHDHGTLRPP